MGKRNGVRRVGSARFTRDEDGWWVATAETVGAHTQGRTIEQAEERLKEAVGAMLDVDPDEVAFATTVIDLPKGVDKALSAARAAAEAAEKQARESERATLRAAQLLTKEGLSLRDAGRLLNLSRQRIHQILEAADARPHARK